MKKKVILIMAGVILLGCVGCSNEKSNEKSPEKGNTSIEIETIEVETIEIEEKR